jgi:tetratricopeptide (TPR) repeat protein
MTTWLAGAGLVLLLAVGAWVFVYLPDRIQPPASVPTPPAAAGNVQPQAAAASRPEDQVAPYEALQIERERRRAQETLARFVLLQIKLEEQMHVAQWAKDEFNAALQLANDGDALFTKQRYDDAMTHYEEGIAALTKLNDAAEDRFNVALTAAAAALDRRDAAAAEDAFASAARIYPDDPRIAAGRIRMKLVPELIDLFDDAERAVERNDWRAALENYRAINNLDPATSGIGPALAAAAARVGDLDFQGLLSTGYAALDAGDFDAAKRAFTSALRQRPNDAAASDGLSQVEQRSTLSRIDQLQQQAQKAEGDERWSEALAAYSEVLKVDPTIKFAMDGHERAQTRVDLDQKLSAAIADPGALSSDSAFAETALLYKGAVAIADPGPRLTRQLDQLETILAVAAEPVAVTLTSDAETEVTISQLGPLGTFSRKEIRLRPGRYLIMGSRDGRRDVRREFEVTPKMPPVEISCQETI